jgi:3-dehydroquinate synthase
MESYKVSLGERSYPVLFGASVYADMPGYLKQHFPGSRFALVTNETLVKIYERELKQWQQELSLITIVIPDGEQYKTLATWEMLLTQMLTERLDRKTVVIAFGGGVVGDITGFAASCFLRGIRCVQIPTTLLAMVDSSVGGKTGVNHAMGKNLIGAFHQPSLVWVDTAFLNTLPQREFLAGYAELFKYAFIGGEDMFGYVFVSNDAMLNRNRDRLAEGIRRSIAIKAGVVARDEKETSGERAKLNFGHTFAHAFERFFGYGGLLHGEAVLLGIACACELGKRMGTIPAEYLPEYDALLKKLPRIALPQKPDAEALYQNMFSDKKTLQGAINFIMPAAPGTSVMRNDVPKDYVMDVLRSLIDC